MTRTGWLALCLLGIALQAQALTLGRLRGAAIIGQPLELVVQITPDGDETLSSLCAEVEVYHADARQDSGRVQLSAEPATPGQPLNLRIASSAVVDEPMVTLYVRAGCAQKTSRRYVLLADIAADPPSPVMTARIAQAAATVPTVTPPATALPAPVQGSAAAGAEPVQPRPAGNAARPARTRPAAERSAPAAREPAAPAAAAPAPSPAPARPAVKRPVAPKPAPAKAPPPPPAKASTPPPAADKLQAGRAAGQSRLRLDPVELLAERVATLESVAASATAPSAGLDAQDAQRIRTLEDSVKTLVAIASKNETNMLDLRKRLEQAESERYANPMVYALALALLASLVAIAVLLVRRNAQAGEQRWWGEAAERPVGQPLGPRPPEPPAQPAEVPQPSAPISLPDSLGAPLEPQLKPALPPSRPAPVTQVDVSLVEMSESTFDRLMQTGATHSAVRKVRQTAPAPLAEPAPTPTRRPINSDELFDIRQQAEFFVSLGQTDQAVRILENRISESGESSPAAYLDLLKIFHSLGLKADFRQVREDFNLLFNAKVPDFAGFADEGRDLEDYPRVLADIELAWARGNPTDLLEGLLFREQWNTTREVFDLAAFRDLLLLHAVAQTAAGLSGELQAAAEGRPVRAVPSSQFGLTLPGTSSLVVPAVPSSELAQDADAPLPELEDVGAVDIDLSEPSAETPAAPVASNLIDFDLPPAPPKGGSGA